MSSEMPNSTCEGNSSATTSSIERANSGDEYGLPSADQFKRRLNNIKGGREIREVLAFCTYIYEREERREASFESKATTLMGFGALAAAFVSGFAALLLDEATALWPCVVRGLAVAYGLLVLSFLAAIVSALVALWPHEIMAPSPEDILNLDQREGDLTGIRRERAGAFYESYLANRRATNRRASWVMVAQISVASGMVFLLLIALLLAGYLILAQLMPIAVRA